MFPHKHDTMLTWNEGGIKAPLEMWIQEIVMALPAETQKEILSRVIARVEEINEAIVADEAKEDEIRTEMELDK